MKNSIDSVSEFIFDIEKELDLFQSKIDGIYFWKLIRFNLTNTILKNIGLFGEAHPKKQSFKSNIVDLIKKDFLIFKFNAMNTLHDPEYLIFRSPRKSVYNNERIDIYTSFLENEIKQKKGNRILALELEPNEGLADKIVASPLLASKKLLEFFIPVKFTSQDIELINGICRRVQEAFGFSFELKRMIQKYIRRYKSNYRYYEKLFEKFNPKMIFIICSYGLEGLIAAAKSTNVEVVEIQHGTISRKHLGYSFPNLDYVEYFPSKIFLFGSFWKDITPIPLEEKDIYIYGYPYLQSKLKNYKSINFEKNKVLFLSQGTIGHQLSELAYKFADQYPMFNIVYKLHPSEYGIWKDKYEYLASADRLCNFEIIDSSNIDLYNLIATAEYQVGVYSTVIFEGLALEKKTILINLPGIEHMEYLIKNNVAKLADDTESLKDSIMDFKKNSSYDSSYFFGTSKNYLELFDE